MILNSARLAFHLSIEKFIMAELDMPEPKELEVSKIQTLTFYRIQSKMKTKHGFLEVKIFYGMRQYSVECPYLSVLFKKRDSISRINLNTVSLKSQSLL